MNLTIESGVLVEVAIISIGQLAERVTNRWLAAPQPAPAPPAPPASAPPAAPPPSPSGRVTTLPPPSPMMMPQPPMVVAQPPLVAGGYRDPYPSGGECLGCAAARADVAALKAEVERIKDHGVSRTEFERHREEVKESLAEDRKVRAEIKTAFDRMAGAKEERARRCARRSGGKEGSAW